jgi:apolipoprotein N-acyltransferase
MLPEGRVLLSGALRREQDGNGVMRGYNSLIAFDDTAKAVAIYDKVHLVPFGEYLPLAPVLTALGLQKLTHGLGSFDTGPGSRPPLTVPGLPPVAGLICYEVLFPGAVIDDGQRPGAIINVTNDGWFGDTTGPRQHAHQARVRAVEEGLPIVRAANNGISAVFDPYGRITAWIGMNERKAADSVLPAAAQVTPYGRFRDWIFWAEILVSWLIAFAARRSYR